jgi:hypothetical protein
MTTTINADTVVGGAIVTADASGVLGLQAAGVTKLTVSSTGVTIPVSVIATPASDGLSTGPATNSFNCGYTSSAIGDLVYLDSSATWQKCDANTLALYNGFLGMAMEVKASGAALLVALPGSFVWAAAQFPTFTVGSPVYMSETPGAVTQTAPTTTDSATRVIGWAIHADKLWFQPSPDYITRV